MSLERPAQETYRFPVSIIYNTESYMSMPFVHFCYFHHSESFADSNPHKSGLLSQTAQELLEREFLSTEQDVLQGIQILLAVFQFAAEPTQSFTQTADT